MFLLSMKQFTIFFLIATIINIPNYIILNQKNSFQFNTLQDAFSYISIGALGEDSTACDSSIVMN